MRFLFSAILVVGAIATNISSAADDSQVIGDKTHEMRAVIMQQVKETEEMLRANTRLDCASGTWKVIAIRLDAIQGMIKIAASTLSQLPESSYSTGGPFRSLFEMVRDSASDEARLRLTFGNSAAKAGCSKIAEEQYQVVSQSRQFRSQLETDYRQRAAAALARLKDTSYLCRWFGRCTADATQTSAPSKAPPTCIKARPTALSVLLKNKWQFTDSNFPEIDHYNIYDIQEVDSSRERRTCRAIAAAVFKDKTIIPMTAPMHYQVYLLEDKGTWQVSVGTRYAFVDTAALAIRKIELHGRRYGG